VAPEPNRIDAVFAQRRAAGLKTLAPFVCGGYPSPASTAAALPALEDAGASIVEVGIPFSDPIADGPVIASAMHDAIESGVTPEGVLEAVASVRDHVSLGLVAMVSVSIVDRLGRARAAGMLREAGFDGVILPDVPLEEAPPYIEAARAESLTASLLVAPTSEPARAAEIARACSGFVYVVTRKGITGGDSGQEAGPVADRVAALRGETDLPLACGFGIASASGVAGVVHASTPTSPTSSRPR
jgi:tryptophan synthase alpha chain